MTRLSSRVSLRLTIVFLCMAGIFSFSFPAPSLAQQSMKVTVNPTTRITARLTEASIRDFYQQSADIFKKDYSSFVIFTNKSMHPDYTSNGVTKIITPGQAPVSQNTYQNKAQVLDGAKQAYDSVRNAAMQNDVTAIKIEADGQSATVINEPDFRGINLGGATASSHGTCTDSLVLSKDGEPQLMKSDCSLTMTLQPQQQ